MDVQVEFYGGLGRLTGTRRHAVTALAEGATVDALAARLSDDLPRLRPRLEAVMFAVGNEIVDRTHELHDGDEVALLPPVSGG